MSDTASLNKYISFSDFFFFRRALAVYHVWFTPPRVYFRRCSLSAEICCLFIRSTNEHKQETAELDLVWTGLLKGKITVQSKFAEYVISINQMRAVCFVCLKHFSL